MPRTHPTIVVLEEHAAVQELIDQALRAAGYRVLVTNNPMEIIGLASRIRVDLLIGDIGALEATEPKLAQCLTRISPVLTLGAPFSLQELQDAVARALDAEDARRSG